MEMGMSDVGYHPDFRQALVKLGHVFERYARQTGHRPLLVGGSAVSIYTAGQITSGDFDVIAPWDDVFHREILAEGFLPEDRLGYGRRGYYHPDLPTIGVELVSKQPFNGRMDATRIALVPTDADSMIELPPIEDLIADRLGQYASGAAPEMLEQARLLYDLAGEIRRI